MENTTSWKFYTDSVSSWAAMLDAIRNATESIELEQYILYNDTIGTSFLNLLKQKGNEGVKVRILCDEVGSFPLSRSSLITEIVGPSIELRFFNPIVPWNPHREALFYFRDHRKLLVVDGKIGFTGGICIAEEMRNWRESCVRVEGYVVKDMLSEFNVMWNREYKRPRYYLEERKEIEGEKDFKYITNAPLPRKRFMYRELIRAVKSAKKYVYLTTPYFLPDHRLLRAIKKAKKSGVEVRLLIPENPDLKLVGIGARTYFEDLLKHKVKIFRYEKMIHSKTFVIDGIWSSIGSLNLDNVSLRYNFEANIVSQNRQFAFELERQFLEDLKMAKELDLEIWQNRPLRQKIEEILIWPFRKLL